MGRKCCVPFCRSGYKSTQHQYFDDRIAVFQFPSDTEQRNKWIEAIPRSNWTPSPHSGVCEKHFIEADFIIHSVDKNNFRAAKKNLMNRRLYRKRISPTAIPTIFPTPESLVRRVRRSKSDLDIKGEDDDDSLFCVVPHCKLAYGTMGNYPPGLGHYLFPEDLDLRQKWYDAIPKSEWNSSEDARVCSLHFDEHDYIGETKTMGPLTVGELREDAIPHIFPRSATALQATNPGLIAIQNKCLRGLNTEATPHLSEKRLLNSDKQKTFSWLVTEEHSHQKNYLSFNETESKVLLTFIFSESLISIEF